MADEETVAGHSLGYEPLLELSEAARRWMETDDIDAALHDIVYTCRRIVPCRSAAIAVTTSVPNQEPVAVRAASDPDEFGILLETVQHVPGSPGVLAAAMMSTVRCPDLANERRPGLSDFASAVVRRTAVRATMAFGLQLRQELVGVLNVYFDRPQDLDGAVGERATAIANQASLVLGARQAEQRADQFEAALQTSRTIGAAIGILVERHRITHDAAFETLRAVSQLHNSKLHSVAERLVATGTLTQ